MLMRIDVDDIVNLPVQAERRKKRDRLRATAPNDEFPAVSSPVVNRGEPTPPDLRESGREPRDFRGDRFEISLTGE